MGDRQDIDALLIGALYGELDAADEARLETHLASHPADRAAMDSLAETRIRVRDQLATLPQAEPAPAISTLILQEAARRAPRRAPRNEKGGVLAWLQGVFQPIARHPALAGALALVLVGGAAGVLYQRGKVDTADHASAPSEPAQTGAAAPAPGTQPQPQPSVDRDGENDVATKDDDKTGEKKPDPALDAYQVQLADQQQNGEAAKGILTDGKEVADNRPSQDPTTGTRRDVGHGGYLKVTRPERQPKTIEDHEQLAFRGAAGAAGAGGAAAGSGNGAGHAATVGTGAGPGGAAGSIAGDDVTTATSPTTAPGPPPKATATAGTPPATPGTYRQNEDAKLTEWAAVQHKQMVALVKAGNCTEAGKIGSDVAAKAPEYYAANIENDRAVRGCKQYIDQAKRKKANEAYKSRAHDDAESLSQPDAAQ